MAGWVSGLFSAKTKLPLIEWRPGREEGEPVEGFPYPDGRRRSKESIALPGQCVAENDSLEGSTQLIFAVPPEQRGDIRPKGGKKETSRALQAHAVSKNAKAQTSE